MIDFTNMPTRKKAYAGANGGKIAVIYDGERELLRTQERQKRSAEKWHGDMER